MTQFAPIDTTSAEPATDAPMSPRMAHLMDVAERAVLFLLTATFLVRFIPTVGLHPYNLLLMVSEMLSAWFILFRRRGEVLATVHAWIIAFAGTFAPLMALPGGTQLLPPAFGITLMTVGLAISISAKASLRRSFGLVAANRGIKRGGPYKWVRHPMYLGYLLTHIGFLTVSFLWANVAVYALCWIAMGMRIKAEEQILGRDPVYRAYRHDVTSRLIPRVW
jgi:protein-S-isoprenylcysteine O-methyltransferase Ste14